MEKPALTLQSYLIAGIIPLLLTVGCLFHCPVSVSREVTDHCGRPVENLRGEAVMEIDHWATWLANWPSNLCAILTLVLFGYFLYLNYRDSRPRNLHQADFIDLS